MARITVEDCLEHVDNRFQLVLTGSKRARQIAIHGKDPMVPRENDKPTVLALREISQGLVTDEVLNQPEEFDELEETVEAQASKAAQAAEEAGPGEVGQEEQEDIQQQAADDDETE